MPTKTSALKAWLPAAAWMLTIFLFSTDVASANHTSRIIEPLLRWINPAISQHAIDVVHHFVRKCGHFTEYALLGLLVFRALVGTPTQVRYSRRILAGCALLIAGVYAATDEFHQCFVASRGPSLTDVLIDTTGAAIGLSMVMLWSGFRAAKT